ncbi:MAG: SDR family oxidoreductase [Novosphingobium sp.]|nr:SDR family oxidoreductase [Novosphingobium sp.]
MPSEDMFSVEGKVCIVTGGAAGIGLGIVEAFDRAGARVLAIGRRANGADIIAPVAPNTRYVSADLKDPSSAETIVNAAVEAFGTVDILINNAAQVENHPIGELTVEYLDSMAATNVRAVLLLIQEFTKVCRGQGKGGRIVNIGSLEGQVTCIEEGMGAYGATKTAVAGLTVSLSRELGRYGINVNGIIPGCIVHPNMLARGEDGIGLHEGELEASFGKLIARTNMKRLGRPDDIAHVCRFLASPASDYVSGQMIAVDGGVTINIG